LFFNHAKLDADEKICFEEDLFLKKFLSIFVFLILLSGVVFGVYSCQKKPDNKGKIEITFWTLQLSDFSDYIKNVIAEYEKTYPNVKIKWIDVPYSEGEKRALAAVMSNDVPDLINMNPGFGATLASKGALIDIKNYIYPENFNKYLPESWKASSVSGMTFGIPWYITSAITIYNKKILNDAGITDYNSVKTYEDLGKLAPVIKKKTDKFVLMPNLTESGYMLNLFNKYDIPIVDKTGKKALFNTPEAVRVLSFWTDMYGKKYIPAVSITEGHRAALEKYQAGETAFIVAGANFLKIIKENAPEIYKVSGVSSQITGSNGKVDFSLMNLVVPKKSKNPEIAVDFALFLTNHENQLKFCKLAPILPSTKETLDSDFFKANNQAIEGNDLTVKGRIVSAQQLKNALTPAPQLRNQKDLNEIIDFATQQALLKEKTPEEALNTAVKGWNQILTEN
jgi:putative chitobiose transport system substrate-binding protein